MWHSSCSILQNKTNTRSAIQSNIDMRVLFVIHIRSLVPFSLSLFNRPTISLFYCSVVVIVIVSILCLFFNFQRALHYIELDDLSLCLYVFIYIHLHIERAKERDSVQYQWFLDISELSTTERLKEPKECVALLFLLLCLILKKLWMLKHEKEMHYPRQINNIKICSLFISIECINPWFNKYREGETTCKFAEKNHIKNKFIHVYDSQNVIIHRDNFFSFTANLFHNRV